MFQSSSSPQKPSSTAPFGVWLDHYTQQANLSQNQLAIASRMNQSTLNKIANHKISDVSVDRMIGLCLVLQLTERETIDLLARRERAFSPANPRHKIYLKMIRRNNKTSRNFDVAFHTLTEILDEVDEYLVQRGYEQLPYQD